MKKINLPLICDVTFTAFCAFILFYTALRHYSGSVYIALPFAIYAAFLFGALAFLIISGKQKKRRIIFKNAKERELLKTHLSLLSKSESAKLIAPCLEDGAKAERFRICTDDKVYYPMFTFERLTESDIAAVIKRKTEKHKVVLCNQYTPEAESLAARFGITFLCADDLFDKLKESGNLPEKYLCEEVSKSGIVQKIRAHFNKKLTLSLFLSGSGLIALSYFTFFPIYYIVSGSVLIVLAVAALFIS